jgi:hypothetical protein
MANYADGARTPRTLTEREQRLLLKVTCEHRAGFRDHMLYALALGCASTRSFDCPTFRPASPRTQL